MELIIHFDNEGGRMVDATDRGKKLKNRLGVRPNTLSQTIRINGLRNRIDLRWKIALCKIMERNAQFKREHNAIITIIHPDLPAPSLAEMELGVDERLTSFSCRNIRKFVGHLANYIICVQRNRKHAARIGEVDLGELVRVAGRA